MKSTLFIVNSPFQCLCMLEAISVFKIEKYEVLVVYSDTFSIDKIHTLLEEFSINYSVKKVAHIVYDFIPLFLQKHNKFDSIFIGDYYEPFLEILGKIYAKKKYELYYLDDGIQALTLFSSYPRKRFKEKKVKIVWNIYDRCLSWKRCQKYNYFTIYNVVSDRMTIIHHNLSFLSQKHKLTTSGVYIIGTNSSTVVFSDKNYFDYLDALLIYIKKRWPQEMVYYCPHRRDKNNDVNRNWCNKNSVIYFETAVSVEFDFTKNGLYPISVIGFTSNALFTLKAIYPNSNICTIDYRLQNEIADSETVMIRKQLIEYNINLLKLFK